MEISEEMIKSGAEPTRDALIDQKDFAALWAMTILFSLLCTLVGLAWQPIHFEIIPSRERDRIEAIAQDQQNQELANLLNQERTQFDPATMGKIIAPRSFSEVLFVDLARVLLFPTFPTLAFAIMIRKTLLADRGIRRDRSTG